MMYTLSVRRGRWAVLLCAGLLGSCQSEVRGTFTLRFQSPQAAEAALTVEVAIRRGRCAQPGERLHHDRFFAAEQGMLPPSLQEGRYNIWAEARTAGCIPIAVGCVDVELPDDADVELTMIDQSMPVFDQVSTEACEQWLARRRVLNDAPPDPLPPPITVPDPLPMPMPMVDAGAQDAGTVDAGPGMSTSEVSGDVVMSVPDGGEPAAVTMGEAGRRCEEDCPPCTAQWRCCNEMGDCGCTVVPGLCWVNIEAAIR